MEAACLETKTPIGFTAARPNSRTAAFSLPPHYIQTGSQIKKTGCQEKEAPPFHRAPP